MKGLLQSTLATIEKHDLLSPGELVLLAISGGPDSIALANVLLELGYKLVLAHCNFNLRPEANEEAKFVLDFAADQKIKVFLRDFDTISEVEAKGKSIQMVARDLRYSFFEELMQTEGIAKCATAHHADDNAETQILSLFKGRWPEVIKSIPVQRGPYIRPFIAQKKTDILAYLEEIGQDYCLDRSNLDTKYDRNLIRNVLIPLLEKLNPSWQNTLSEKQQRLNQAAQLNMKLVGGSSLEQGGNEIDLGELKEKVGSKNLEIALSYLLREWPVSGNDIRELLNLAEANSGAKYLLETGFVLKDRDKLIFVEAENGESGKFEEEIAFEKWGKIGLIWDKKYEGKEIRLELVDWGEGKEVKELMQGGKRGEEQFFLDVDAVNPPLRIRNWQKGDQMVPFGMKGKRKLSEIFIDLKIPLHEKNKVLVFEDSEQILCLSGFRIADSVKVRPETKRLLKISIKPIDEIE